jgi:AcrR family transcriptional regulator
MSSARRRDAAERLRVQLSQFDWSGQAASRRAALKAFLRLSSVHGFSAVTMRMLATELTIKAPSLYAYFPDGRDEIVAESLRWHFCKFGSAILAAVENTETATEFWDAMVREHLIRQVMLPESDLWDLLVATDAIMRSLPSGLHEEVDGWVAFYEDMYRAAAIDMGIDGDTDEQIRLVLTVVEGARRWCTVENLPHAITRAVPVSHTLIRLPAAETSRAGVGA